MRMTDACRVETCTDVGMHEIDDEHLVCLRHAETWDHDTEQRLGRLTELHAATPDADEHDVWNAYVSEWLGAQS